MSEELIRYLTTRSHRQRVGDAIAAVETLREISLSRKIPTPEQRLVLLKFPGFGSIPSLFTQTQTTVWEQNAREDFKKLLTPDEYHSARKTTLNQHQTDPRVIRLLWQTMQQLGFKGGKVFDPGCSVGWMSEFMPSELRHSTTMVGVEIDGLCARIAKQLHPQNAIFNRAIQEFSYPVRSLDGCVANPPFGDGVFSTYNGMGFKIGLANWVLAKTLDLLKPGALLVAIVGTGVLDGVMVDRSYLKFRQWVDTQAVFLGAVRLPMQAFSAIANTDVGCDILIMQKRYSAADNRVSEPFIQVHPFDGINAVESGLPVHLNEYYWKHPEHLVGKPDLCKLTRDRFATRWDMKADEAALYAAIERALDDIVLMKEHLTTGAG